MKYNAFNFGKRGDGLQSVSTPNANKMQLKSKIKYSQKMSLYKSKYRIQSNRLRDWDYSDNGIYFVTICCANRECVFGDIVVDKIILNQKGKIVSDEIKKSIDIRKNWVFHNWVIMPNHIHLLIEIKEMDLIHNVETDCSPSPHENPQKNPQEPKKIYRSPKSISSFVAQFKSVITRQFNELDNSKNSIWQTNYHDSIIRNQEMFQNVYFYIHNNPKNWSVDSLK